MSVIRFDAMENLVDIANNTIYGLAAAVVTNDIDKALYVANNIRAGSVWWVLCGLNVGMDCSRSRKIRLCNLYVLFFDLSFSHLAHLYLKMTEMEPKRYPNS